MVEKGPDRKKVAKEHFDSTQATGVCTEVCIIFFIYTYTDIPI